MNVYLTFQCIMAKNPLSSILETHKLNGYNYRLASQLYSILAVKKRLHILHQCPPHYIVEDLSDENKAANEAWRREDFIVKCYMIATVVPHLGKRVREL